MHWRDELLLAPAERRRFLSSSPPAERSRWRARPRLPLSHLIFDQVPIGRARRKSRPPPSPYEKSSQPKLRHDQPLCSIALFEPQKTSWLPSSSTNFCKLPSSRGQATFILSSASPRFSLARTMRKLETKTLEADDTVQLMKSIAPERCQRELQETGSSDFGFAFGTLARFRVSIFKQRGNISMVLRQIPNDKLTPEQLGLPEAVVKMVERPRGLVLVTGPTGSGKSTTLASLINFLNEEHDHHIITIEDPIEFYHEHKKSTINQREVGVDVPSFSEAIRRALRQDPTVFSSVKCVTWRRSKPPLAPLKRATSSSERSTPTVPKEPSTESSTPFRGTSRIKFERSLVRPSSVSWLSRYCRESVVAMCRL